MRRRGWGGSEREKQKTTCPCDHIAALKTCLSFDCSEEQRLYKHTGRNGRQVGGGERGGGRGAQMQPNINSVWSPQPHCGNFYMPTSD